MTTLCPACRRVVSNDARVCSRSGADISQLHERDFRDKLLGTLSHPDRDTVIRAAVALAARHDAAALQAIETVMLRFQDEPHVLAGLLTALRFVADDEAQRIALVALDHRSFIVRYAAAQLLEHINGADEESKCAHRER